jgi:hypothetical protein
LRIRGVDTELVKWAQHGDREAFGLLAADLATRFLAVSWFTPPKLSSVFVAIPAARLPEFAEAALSPTFYLARSAAAAP